MDRELLELAAKAGEIYYAYHDGKFLVDFRGVGCRPWNPLEDDGDALRLAVKLHLDILFCDDDVEASANTGAEIEPFGISKLGNDQYAATRRAIVRAAAEIGKTL